MKFIPPVLFYTRKPQMKQGYLAIPREEFEGDLWKEKRSFSRFEAWIWLNEQAKYKDCIIMDGNTPVKLKRGQLYHSIRFMGLAWGWHKDKVLRFIDYLCASGRIKYETLNETLTETQARHKPRHITICNYGDYTNERDTDETLTETATRHSTRQNRIKNKESKEDTTIVVSVESDKDSVITVDTKTQAHEDWRKDFQVYLNITRQAYLYIVNTPDVFATQQRLNPGLDVQKSLEKACVNFWATEAGWQHKKKSRSKNIDMVRTLVSAIPHQSNRVYEQLKGTDAQQNSGGRFIDEAYRRDILRRLQGGKSTESV